MPYGKSEYIEVMQWQAPSAIAAPTKRTTDATTLTISEIMSRFILMDYFIGSYRVAKAPEANSNRLTSFKSNDFDSPANNVGPT